MARKQRIPSQKEGWKAGWLGHPPEDGILFAENDEWALYERPEKDEFLNLKLCAKHRNMRKANFWFAFDRNRRQLVGSHDYWILKAHFPLILDWVEKAILAYVHVRGRLTAMVIVDRSGTRRNIPERTGKRSTTLPNRHRNSYNYKNVIPPDDYDNHED